MDENGKCLNFKGATVIYGLQSFAARLSELALK